jgi:hypothetical protein
VPEKKRGRLKKSPCKSVEQEEHSEKRLTLVVSMKPNGKYQMKWVFIVMLLFAMGFDAKLIQAQPIITRGCVKTI